MNSINLKSIAIVASLLLAGTTISLAQHDHSGGGHGSHSQPAANPMSNPPHGGMIKMADKYHIEMVVDMVRMDDKVSVYLLNGKGKTLPNEDVTGMVMFMYDDNSTVREQLVARGDDHFAAQLKDSKPFTAMISLKVKGKMIKASFEHGGLDDLMETATYTCTMHPEVRASEPGRCPKCGMYLTKIDKKKQATYTCPMHPEIQSKEPGSCPKCGMNLVKKK